MNYLQRRIKLAEKIKKLLPLLGIILLVILLSLVIIFINKNIPKAKTYQLKNKTSYTVTLILNNYYASDKIKAHNYYIAKAIKSIDIYFDYEIKKQNKEKINYSYDIAATIKSYADNGTKLIWTKDFPIKRQKKLSQKVIKIKENYELDYQFYVNYLKTFQEYYNIKTESYLYVKLNVKINDKDSAAVLLTIPLSENIIEITEKEDKNSFENKQNMDYKKVIVFIILTIADIYLIFRTLSPKEKDKIILKEYHDIIIPIQNKPNINTDHILYLASLKALINIALNNDINVFNYQNIYYIIIDNIYYIYNMNQE